MHIKVAVRNFMLLVQAVVDVSGYYQYDHDCKMVKGASFQLPYAHNHCRLSLSATRVITNR